MKIFITGGTGFIGTRVVNRLLACGHTVRALARSEKAAAALQAMGAISVRGDVTQRDSLPPAMTGSEVVIHLAGWYKLGARDSRHAEAVNVSGTRNVLEVACELGIPKIIYTSTVAVFGDTTAQAQRHQLADETWPMPSGPLLTIYDRTKWKAHREVVQPLIAQGAPIVVLLPGVVYGPGDTSLVGQIMGAFYHGWFILFPGPETLLSYAHVEDTAEGHLLALERGRPGESYILAGPTLSLGEAARIWAAVSQKPAPMAYVPAVWIHRLEPLARFLRKILPTPGLMSPEAVRVLGATYAGRDDKAAIELGWRARPVVEGFRQTFAQMSNNYSKRSMLK